MDCRYRVGDALTQAVLYILFTLFCFYIFVLSDRYEFLGAGIVLTASMLLGAFLNKREREESAVRKVRELKQLQLGVPPEEMEI